MNNQTHHSVADLIQVDELQDWSEGDLALMLSEQMGLRVCDFINQSMGIDQMSSQDESEESAMTLSQLFSSSKPSVIMLRSVKDAAKLSAGHPRWPLPGPIAHVMYIASIAVADLRCGEQISKLSKRDYDESLLQCAQSEWITDPIRHVCKNVLEARGK